MRILLVLGTRPEAIKMAPLIRALRNTEAETIVCFTGQHREMVTQVAEYFQIQSDIDLDLMRPNQSLSALTALCLERLDEVVRESQPNCVIAQGDTTTVMVTSMLAFYHRLPFVHVEAGLRTGNMHSPWPEEFNRRVAGLVAGLHCAPTTRAAKNLLQEGIPEHQVHVTGNTVIDALLWTISRERGRGAEWEQQHSGLRNPRMVLITGHRRENFGPGFEQICGAIKSLAERFDKTDFVYPVHLNPNVQAPVRRRLAGLPNVHLLPPASYPEFAWLMDRSTIILTDSGGVQEEAPSLRKPVLVMRDTTERPEAVEAGAVELVGTSRDRIVAATSRLLEDAEEYARRQIETNPYGDGSAAGRIAQLVLQGAWQQPCLDRSAA